MKIETEMNSGSKWHRSLMALAVLSAPVVSIAGFSGTASAGGGAYYDVDFDCTAIGDGYLTVTIDPVNDSDNFSVHVKPSTVASWPSNNDYRAVNNKEFDNADFDQIEQYGNGGGAVTLAVATSYDVKIVSGNGNGADTALYSETITILCVAIDFEDIDDFVTIYCSGETEEILVTLPQRDPPSAKGPKYDVYIYESEAKGFSDEETNLDQGGSALFETGEGTFEIEIYLAGDDEPVYSNTIEVDCTTRNPGGGYNINIPKLTTPKLPTTGSDSSTPLLVIAPMMVLLGAGLIVARRRLAAV